MLKSDFHIHTKEDPYDGSFIKYTAKDLINVAARKGFDVLSITNHQSLFFNRSIKDYAKKKGILLIPGMEARIEGKDVLLIDVKKEELKKIHKLSDLEKIKDSGLIIAPHPYLFTHICLGDNLEKYIDCFHAVEYCHFYIKLMLRPTFRFTNANFKAASIAKKYHKPLIGTSDAHKMYQFNRTFTLVDSAKNKDDVIDAIKRSKVKLVTEPLSTWLFLKHLTNIFFKDMLPETLKLKEKVPSDFKPLFFKRFK